MADQDPRIKEIFAAIRQYDDERVRELIEGGLSTEVRNKSGSTPLMLAGRIGSLNTFKTLIELGADVNARDPRGKSVMHHACDDIADYQVGELIAHGADDESILQGLYRSAERGRDSNLITLMQLRPDIAQQEGLAEKLANITVAKKRPMSTKAITAFHKLYPLNKWSSVQSFNQALESISPSTRKLFRHENMLGEVHTNVTKRLRMSRHHQPRI